MEDVGDVVMCMLGMMHGGDGGMGVCMFFEMLECDAGGLLVQMPRSK